jgi:protein SCO1/2
MPLPRRISGPKALIILLGMLAVAGAVVVVAAKRHPQYTPKLDDFGPVPAFAFTDETGHPFPTEAMAGRVTIVDFIFTRCDAVCPGSTARMLDLQERTADLDQAVWLVSFTVDPAYDTPDVLARYAKDFHADPRRWRFITGDLTELRPVIEGAFMSGIDDTGGKTESGAPNIFHGERFFLVDQNLHIRQFYDTDPPGLARLARDARYLAKHPTAAASTASITTPRR